MMLRLPCYDVLALWLRLVVATKIISQTGCLKLTVFFIVLFDALEILTNFMTMKKLTFRLFISVPLFLLCTLTSCGVEPITEKPTELPVPLKLSKLSVLDPLFKDLVITDTFFLYSPWSDDAHYKFKGMPMDSLQVLALSSQESNRYTYFKDFGACFQFPLDSSRVALIARVPGEYESTVLKLFMFDVQKDSVIHTLCLADVFGDAGEVMWYSSCLFRDKSHKLTLATHWHSEYSHSVDNENDTTVERWNKFYLIDLSDIHADTLSKDSATIVDRYPEIMKRLRSY
jgi:hypothetical protein